MFLPLLITAIVIWTVYYKWQRKRIYEVAKEIPSGLKSLPIIGHAHLFGGSNEDRMKLFQAVAKDSISHGGLSTFWMVNKLYLIVTDPYAADVILKQCLDKDDATMKYIRKFLGNGSIFAKVNIWRPRRKILAPIFTIRNLNNFQQVFSEQGKIMADLMKDKAGQGDFSVWPYLVTYTFDSVCETSLGVKLGAQKNPQQPFLKSFEILLKLIASRMCSPWLYSDAIYKMTPQYRSFVENSNLMYNFVDKLILKKREEMHQLGMNNNLMGNKDDGVMRTFLELMIESSGNEKGYTNIELREEVMVILLAGTDTSAVGAAYTIVLLSRHRDIQEKVHEELHNVFGDSDRPITVEDLTSLKYLEAVIKETMRLYPPVPVTVREVREDVKLPTGTTLVDGIAVLSNIWGMHRNPAFWGDDVDQFRPERFLEGPLKHPAQYIPFSFSVRNCLGYNYAMSSMKTVVASLLRQYRILPPAELDPVSLQKPLRVEFDIMMKHMDNYKIQLELKNKTV